jgi:hypothetical protein
MSQQLGLEPAQEALVQDLMVHVHQVLVHESVVTPNFSVEQHRLVFLRVEPGHTSGNAVCSASAGSPTNTKISPYASRHEYARTARHGASAPLTR